MSMARQLEILALEPFYGGVRKSTLELLALHSRHQWTIHKLPPRRIERRLSTAAHWFAEQVSRPSLAKYHAVFTSDALNLADLFRLMPALARIPSVAYFYTNQLAPTAGTDEQVKIATLSTANSATELWFASMFHMRSFLSDAAILSDQHPDLGGRGPLRAIVSKAQLVHPPVDLVPPAQESEVVDAQRRGRVICVDNRAVAPELYHSFLDAVAQRKEPMTLQVIGDALPHVSDGMQAVVDVRRDEEVTRALRCAEIFITAQDPAAFDPLALRAMAMGCIPVMPETGYFRELLPDALHKWCLFNGTADDLVSKIMDLWYLRRPAVARSELDRIFRRYSPITATGLVDQRLEQLAETAGR